MRVLIAGVQSGVGKTTLVAGLIAALRRRGLSVQPFKVGPDYIDPSYHTLAAGRVCRNLDTWMIPPQRLSGLFRRQVQGADIAVIEGVMGLFDGQNYLDDTGSTAEVAKLTGSPVILVIDAAKMARSAAAVALGYQKFDPQLNLAGFLINSVGGEAHGQGVASAVEQATGLPVLGWLPHNPRLEIPERHLGLVPTAEPGAWQEFINAAADHISAHVDLERLLAVARDAAPLPDEDPLAALAAQWQPLPPDSPVIAVARDEAFNFTYEENLELLQAAGAQIAFFSPLRDSQLPQGTCGVMLSGGFPEMFARQLSANAAMRAALHNAREQDMPIYAECGGLMALTQSITDLEGREYPMFGLLPGRSVMTQRLTMGYRLARAARDTWLIGPDEEVRGHEFHYSAWVDRPEDLPAAFQLIPPRELSASPQMEGVCSGSLWASYVHLPFWTRPELALRFVNRCRNYEAKWFSR
jgi:cobyrinic acid a,c-diamide synthase